MTTSSINNSAGVGNVFLGTDVGSLSIEDALLLVQMDRVRLCESQLQDQINTIRNKNEQMRALNDMKSQLLVLKANFSQDAKETDKLNTKGHWNDDIGRRDVKPVAEKLAEAWQTAGLDASYIDKIKNGSITKAEVDAADQVIKSAVDNLSSSSQMDMVRLQSLNNKRSEAFDTMTNMLKKAADSKSSVVSNFR
jgi:hypothetical protein